MHSSWQLWSIWVVGKTGSKQLAFQLLLMFWKMFEGGSNEINPADYEWKVWVYCSLLAASIPVLIPTVQFGYIYNLWSRYNKPVSREHCSCSCWDTVFKGNFICEILKCDFLQKVHTTFSQNIFLLIFLTKLDFFFSIESDSK